MSTEYSTTEFPEAQKISSFSPHRLQSLDCPLSHGATREPFREPNVRLQLALNLSALFTQLWALAPDLDRCLKLGYVNKPHIVSKARPDTPSISDEEDEQLNKWKF